MKNTNLFKRSIAEGIGTALLILIGAGTAAYNGIITANGNAATLADTGDCCICSCYYNYGDDLYNRQIHGSTY